MSIDATQLRLLIIRPTLQYLGLWSPFRENLLLGTCAQESQCGTYLIHNSVIYHLISALELDSFSGVFDQIIFNLRYAAALAFMSYYRHQDFIDGSENDIVSMAKYWKKYYNSINGAGTEQEFINNYGKYIQKSSD